MVHLLCRFGHHEQRIRINQYRESSLVPHHIRKLVMDAFPFLRTRYFVLLVHCKAPGQGTGFGGARRGTVYDMDDYFDNFKSDLQASEVEALEIAIDKQESVFLLKTPGLVYRMLGLGLLAPVGGWLLRLISTRVSDVTVDPWTLHPPG